MSPKDLRVVMDEMMQQRRKLGGLFIAFMLFFLKICTLLKLLKIV